MMEKCNVCGLVREDEDFEDFVKIKFRIVLLGYPTNVLEIEKVFCKLCYPKISTKINKILKEFEEGGLK